jgi:pectin methylesterase-like acyl-CoA thioesterase
MKRNPLLRLLCVVFAATLLIPQYGYAKTGAVRFPANKASNVNPDTHLVLTFTSAPTLGKSGQVRVYDAAEHRLVDTLDLSIPAGPDPNKRGAAPPDRNTPVDHTTYQLMTIGGLENFHFYPVIIHGNTATIYLHNNHLSYNHKYIVQIDPGVLTTADGSFNGIAGDKGWVFKTRKSGPAANATRIVVAADGSGDFNTVQGAIDFLPAKPPQRVTIFVKDGNYEELVYCRNKSNFTIRGEDRDKVQVGYADNSLFNPPNVPGPSRRDSFIVYQSTEVHLINLTMTDYLYGQAGGLSISGEKNILSHVNINGSGDALQTRGSLYVEDSKIAGAGDTVLSVGPAFFLRCTLQSHSAYMWPRNTEGNHGDVFVDSTFDTPERPPANAPQRPATAAGPMPVVFARSPVNHGIHYAYVEVVLINARLKGIAPIGWGEMNDDTSHFHLWEYNSTNLDDGKPVDVSQRAPYSRQLTMEKDAETVRNYSDPTYVLGGWTPVVDK